MFEEIVRFIRKTYQTEEFIPLHVPQFIGNERDYVLDTIDSTYVSSIGKYVDRFEEEISKYTGAKYTVACVNGTCALHIALLSIGVRKDDLVITQPLSFIATCNAIKHSGADPVFIDIDKSNLGLSSEKLEAFLIEKCSMKDDGYCYHSISGKRVSACVPMHTFGHSCDIDKIIEVCKRYNITVIEDAAEAIGSFYKNKHLGTFGSLGVFSFNGNKTITCGGGGAIVTNDERLAKYIKHLTTQAKVPHPFEFYHDEIGFNYRLPNINAALACAQLEQLNYFVSLKREIASQYERFFENTPYKFIGEPIHSKSNYWLNAILLENREERDEFLKYSNDNGVMTRPAWTLLNKLPMFKECYKENIASAEFIEDRLVNLPSTPFINQITHE